MYSAFGYTAVTPIQPRLGKGIHYKSKCKIIPSGELRNENYRIGTNFFFKKKKKGNRVKRGDKPFWHLGKWKKRELNSQVQLYNPEDYMSTSSAHAGSEKKTFAGAKPKWTLKCFQKKKGGQRTSRREGAGTTQPRSKTDSGPRRIICGQKGAGGPNELRATLTARNPCKRDDDSSIIKPLTARSGQAEPKARRLRLRGTAAGVA